MVIYCSYACEGHHDAVQWLRAVWKGSAVLKVTVVILCARGYVSTLMIVAVAFMASLTLHELHLGNSIDVPDD